jgi:hypothetical protein
VESMRDKWALITGVSIIAGDVTNPKLAESALREMRPSVLVLNASASPTMAPLHEQRARLPVLRGSGPSHGRSDRLLLRSAARLAGRRTYPERLILCGPIYGIQRGDMKFQSAAGSELNQLRNVIAMTSLIVEQ